MVFADSLKFVVRKTWRFPVSRSRQPIRRSRCGHRLRPRALVNSMVWSDVTLIANKPRLNVQYTLL